MAREGGARVVGARAHDEAGAAIGADAAASGEDGVALDVVERGGFAGGREDDDPSGSCRQDVVRQALQSVDSHVPVCVERRHQRDVHTAKLQLSHHPANLA